jgi:hypothetical protein
MFGRCSEKEVGMARRLNIDHDPPRAITDETCALGIACYEGPVRDGKFHGAIVGNISGIHDAERWLKGEKVKFSVKPRFPGKSWV